MGRTRLTCLAERRKRRPQIETLELRTLLSTSTAPRIPLVSHPSPAAAAASQGVKVSMPEGRPIIATTDGRLPDSRWCRSGALGARRANSLRRLLRSCVSRDMPSKSLNKSSAPGRPRGEQGAARSASQTRTTTIWFRRPAMPAARSQCAEGGSVPTPCPQFARTVVIWRHRRDGVSARWRRFNVPTRAAENIPGLSPGSQSRSMTNMPRSMPKPQVRRQQTSCAAQSSRSARPRPRR